MKLCDFHPLKPIETQHKSHISHCNFNPETAKNRKLSKKCRKSVDMNLAIMTLSNSSFRNIRPFIIVWFPAID